MDVLGAPSPRSGRPSTPSKATEFSTAARVKQLAAAVATRLGAGELVVRQPRVAGTNVCAAYHPPGAMRRLLPADLEVLEHRPEGALGNPTQDLWVLRKARAAPVPPATP